MSVNRPGIQSSAAWRQAQVQRKQQHQTELAQTDAPYTIQQGDTIYDLAKSLRQLNDALKGQSTMALTKQLQEYVGIKDPTKVRVGMKIDLKDFLAKLIPSKPLAHGTEATPAADPSQPAGEAADGNSQFGTANHIHTDASTMFLNLAGGGDDLLNVSSPQAPTARQVREISDKLLSHDPETIAKLDKALTDNKTALSQFRGQSPEQSIALAWAEVMTLAQYASSGAMDRLLDPDGMLTAKELDKLGVRNGSSTPAIESSDFDLMNQADAGEVAQIKSIIASGVLDEASASPAANAIELRAVNADAILDPAYVKSLTDAQLKTWALVLGKAAVQDNGGANTNVAGFMLQHRKSPDPSLAKAAHALAANLKTAWGVSEDLQTSAYDDSKSPYYAEAQIIKDILTRMYR